MKHHLMWGEPYGITGLFDQLISPFLHLNNQWPPPEYFRTHINSQNLDQHWIANLYPEPKHLMTASQQYLESLFKVPANNNGYTHWGLKEVRLNAEHASFLQWLYPEAHFLFLIRNPYNAYKSYRMFPKPWYLHQPDLLIDTVEKFANHWLNCSISFIQSSKSLNAKIIQYEHMIAPDFDWTDIENFLGFEVDKNALKNKVDGKNFHSLNPESLEHELNQLEQLVNPLASKLGYSRP
jgi:hypothetical protein